MNSSVKYDSDFKKISHYEKYPELMPWIGENYPNQKMKLLIFGESHYLPGWETKCHLDIDAWFAKRMIENEYAAWISTRGVIESNKSIWDEISKALIEAGIDSPKTRIAFMNFFQYPANKVSATSRPIIKRVQKYVAPNCDVVNEVIEIIKPNLIIFVSIKAYERSWGIRKTRDDIVFTVPHASGSSQWNRVWNDGKTGKQLFIDIVKAAAQ